ncbi:MAG: glycerate kinase [Phycisphaerales bacterium]
MPRSLRVLVAPDKFKGTLSARGAAEAIERGVREAATVVGVAAQIDVCLLADGGEGTAEILARAWDDEAECRVMKVIGPRGGGIDALWWCGGADKAAFDSAAACGLSLVPLERRDPTLAGTFGVGMMLMMIGSGSINVAVGLGGSASVDGGVGLASALGWRFEDDGGRAISTPRGADLGRIARAIGPAEHSSFRGMLSGCRLRVLCDVTTPLLGGRGCAAVFGPQKGATPAQVRQLDDGLRRLVDVVGVAPIERDGAAGGLAYGLRVFAGPLARGVVLESGAKAVLDAAGFARRVGQADLVITGEGRFDLTSYEGKAVGEVIAAARKADRPVLVIAGGIEPGMGARLGVTLAACEGDTPPRDERDAALRLQSAARTAFERWVQHA